MVTPSYLHLLVFMPLSNVLPFRVGWTYSLTANELNMAEVMRCHMTSVLDALSWIACPMGSQLLYHESVLWRGPCGKGSRPTNYHLNALGRRSPS